MDESRIDILPTPEVTEIAEKAEDELTQSISSIPEELVKNMMGDIKIQKYVGDIKIQEHVGAGEEYDEEIVRRIALAGLSLLELLRSLADLPRSNALKLFRPRRDWQLLVPSAKGLAIHNDKQIPFFVLKKILEWERNRNGMQADTDLDSILKHAWLKLSPIQYDSPDSHVIAGVPLKDNSHLLEFVYENIIRSSDFKHPSRLRKNKRRVSRITVPPAVQLKGKGVKFAPNKGPLNEIRFDRRNLTLYLPTVEMDGKTDDVLKNLVLFEWTAKQEERSQPLMSYVDLMERLIEKAEDVQCLQEVGIIHSHLGTNDDVANVWNGMREQLPTNNIKYEPIDNAIYDVKSFYTSKCRTMCTECYGTYFSKPWSAISFFAACILFGVAAFQTYLAWEQVRLQRESMPKT